jgi:4'-phosphopantetheinyl transferase EntD
MEEAIQAEGATAVLRGLFPSTVAITTRPVDAGAASGPHAARWRERQLGRLCAADALLELRAAVITPPHGSPPVWPEGLTGSISHCQALCCAVAAHSRDLCALGVDVERAVPLVEGVELVCGEIELAHFADLPALPTGNWPLLAFSAKEAAYKCQYALTGQLLDFRDFEIDFDLITPGVGRFALRRTRPLPIPAGLELRIEGRWAADRSYVYTAAWIEQLAPQG